MKLSLRDFFATFPPLSLLYSFYFHIATRITCFLRPHPSPSHIILLGLLTKEETPHATGVQCCY